MYVSAQNYFFSFSTKANQIQIECNVFQNVRLVAQNLYQLKVSNSIRGRVYQSTPSFHRTIRYKIQSFEPKQGVFLNIYSPLISHQTTQCKTNEFCNKNLTPSNTIKLLLYEFLSLLKRSKKVWRMLIKQLNAFFVMMVATIAEKLTICVKKILKLSMKQSTFARNIWIMIRIMIFLRRQP